MRSSSIVHLVLASHPVLSISVASLLQPSCGRDTPAHLERAKQQLPRHEGEGKEKKPVQAQGGRCRAKQLSREAGTQHAHEV